MKKSKKHSLFFFFLSTWRAHSQILWLDSRSCEEDFRNVYHFSLLLQLITPFIAIRFLVHLRNLLFHYLSFFQFAVYRLCRRSVYFPSISLLWATFCAAIGIYLLSAESARYQFYAVLFRRTILLASRIKSLAFRFSTKFRICMKFATPLLCCTSLSFFFQFRSSPG